MIGIRIIALSIDKVSYINLVPRLRVVIKYTKRGEVVLGI